MPRKKTKLSLKKCQGNYEQSQLVLVRTKRRKPHISKKMRPK